MKFISAITTAIMVLAMQSFFVADAQAAKPHAKTLPVKVKSSLLSQLAALSPADLINPAKVTEVVMAFVKSSPSYAPEIVAFATQFIGGKLINDPTNAAKVIPAFVNAAVQSEPRFTADIVGLAIGAVPDALKVAVVPQIASDVMASAPNKKAKAEILNAALEATQGETKVTQILDSIANQNDIKIVDNTNGEQARYFVDDQGIGDFATGDQGVGTLGSFGGGASGGGGNPGNSANSPAPAS